MKIDIGFFDKDGNYKEDIQEVEMLSVDEINKLQAYNKKLNDIIDSYQPRIEELKELKVENERLKAQLDVLEEDNKKLLSENDALYNNSLQEVKEDLVKRVWNLQTENKELAHYLACMTEQRNKANTCLQEIKAIAEKLMADNLCNNCDGIGLDANCQDTGCPYYQMDKILQKITKAGEE